MSTSTKAAVTKFAEEHNIDWWVQKNSWGEWDYEVELETKNENDVDCGVRSGVVERHVAPTAAKMWFIILGEMKSLVA